MKNRTGKYLKYAIGEIILVVIGILLALAINNWNNNRQQHITNKKYLTKMLIDLSVTKSRLDQVVSEGFKLWPSLESAVNQCDSLLVLTYQGLEERHFETLVNAKLNSGGSVLNINDNTYNEMLNTGKIYTLKSDTLSTAISRYFKMCEREVGYNTQNTETVVEGIEKYEDGFGKMFMDYDLDKDNFDLKNYPFYFDRNAKAYKDFQIGLKLMFDGQSNNLRKMNLIIKETDALIAVIKKEQEHYD